MPKKPIQPQDKYVLRLPDGLRDRIKAAAAANNRSMNAEIVGTLEDAYPPEPTIEDIIHWARDIIDGYEDAPDYARLRTLRDALRELSERLQKGKREGYPPTEREEFLRNPPEYLRPYLENLDEPADDD